MTTELDLYMENATHHWILASRTSMIIFIIALVVFLFNLWQISRREKHNKKHYSFNSLWHINVGKSAIITGAIVLISLVFLMPKASQGKQMAEKTKVNTFHEERTYHITHIKSRHFPNSIVNQGKNIDRPSWYNYF